MIFDAIGYVVYGIFNTLYAVVIVLLLIGLCTLIILLLPVAYAQTKGEEFLSKCNELIHWLIKAHSKWRNRPRVKTGPMPIIGHPYR